MAQGNGEPFTYNFELSYYDNFLAKLGKGAATGGNVFEMYHGVDAAEAADTGKKELKGWKDYAEVVDGIDEGINIAPFVQQVYNGASQICLVDKVAREIGEVFGDIGLCGVGQVIYKIFDSVTDVFGSFICTATVESLGSECGQILLKKFKKYRDEEVTDEEGLQMVKGYRILGPRIVAAIEADPYKETMYMYLWAEYISKLEILVDSNRKDEVIDVYLQMMNEMIELYEIKTNWKWGRR